MDKTALVSVEISTGEQVLEILERANIKVSATLWAFLSEYSDWRLIVAARQFDTLPPRDAYRHLHELLAAGGLDVGNPPPIMILPVSDSFIKGLLRHFGKTRSVEGMRLGGQMIGDRFVEDAYVYRVAS
ncbi:MAG: hypothetical protein IT165_20360 [Bryobacterales bacterium]|nr:hypothetical protein [Bryobacterales bacterium]